MDLPPAQGSPPFAEEAANVVAASPTLAKPADARASLFEGWRALADNYVARRIGKAVLTIWAVATMTFFLVRLMPGNPVEQFIGQLIAQYQLPYAEARDQAASLFAIDLDQPVYLQYFSFLGKLAQGDLGTSIKSQGVKVTSIIVAFLPWTLFCVGISLFISFGLGIILGALMAYWRGSVLDYSLTTFGSLLHSIPNYLIAMILIIFLGVRWELLPVVKMRGSMSPGIQPGFTLVFVLDVLFHAALPILTYVVTTVGTWMLTMKASTTATLEEDYVNFARAKGLTDGRIRTAYVGRNAILPLFTQLTLSIGFVFGGSVLIESIFVYRGIGTILVSAVSGRDYPVMQGCFLITTASVVFANLLADLLYGYVDPRVRVGQ
ncbi:MAG: ABC transporter permease [Chloroflexota bacterium]